VQNRFYPDTSYDVPIRQFCGKYNIVFQSFWTLTGNPSLRKSATVKGLGEKLKGLGIEDGEVLALYCLVMGLGNVTVLDGTTNEQRMRGDVEGMEKVGKWIEKEEGKEVWEEALKEFKKLVGDIEGL
jgi:hypothetical protein